MSVESTALELGKIVAENFDVFADVFNALKSGTPKEAIQAAIRGAMVKVSTDAIQEELFAAEARKHRTP